ncbi:MAG TPA: TetR/AcrR family transcriptional regulator [bacterium]|nr:TetR/AcrR family transcriptional regulator [bacterium]
MKTRSTSKQRCQGDGETSIRGRILDAAFSAFMEGGYADTSTREIARRARVSKRELYALVGNKKEMLAACISERANRLRVPADLSVPRNRESLAHVLASLGTQLLREISDPAVIGVFRVAIAEAVRAPEIARVLDSIGRETSRAIVRKIMAQARSVGLLAGHPAEMAEQFAGLLWGNLMVSLMLGVADRPTPRDIARRARCATTAFLKLYPEPNDPPQGVV